MTSSSQAGSRNCANHTALQENGWEKKTNATCGQKCLEQYRKSDHATWWGKMFADSLVGTGDWYSMRCRLTWKLKVTSSSRLYFQLAPSTLPTEEKGFGLWPTPTSVQRDHPERVQGLLDVGAETMMSRKAGDLRPNSVLDMVMFSGLLPRESDGHFAEHTCSRTTPNTDNARNATPRNDFDGNRQEVIGERKLSQFELIGYNAASDTNDQRECAGLRSFPEADGEIPKRNENAELGNSNSGDVTNAASERLEGCIGRSSERERFTSNSLEIGNIEQQANKFEHARPCWDFFPTQPPICGGNDGFSTKLDGITFPKWRSESIKAYGNAIVPQVVYEIFKVIEELDNKILKYL